MRFLRLLTTTIAASLAVAALAVPAGAQGSDPPPRDYGESGVRAGGVDVRARTGWLPAGADGSGGGGSSCTTSSVRIIIEDDFAQPVNRNWTTIASPESIPFTATPGDLQPSLPTHLRHFSPTGRWYEVTCDGVITIVPEGGPAVNVAGLVQEALDRVDPPEPELAMTPAELHYAQLQSWLAIEPGYWVDRQATAAAGRVSVTATVTPYEAEWDMGDGGSVTCDDAGVPWSPGLPDEATDCAYTYTTSSAGAPGDSYTVATTVRFSVTVVVTAPGSYGPFPDLERTTTEVIQVGEIQAVND